MTRQQREMANELLTEGRRCNLPMDALGRYCQSGRDGDCNWKHCPQLRDNEPEKTGRHCPIDLHCEEREGS